MRKMTSDQPVLVAVFLRGAIDGLNVVVPYGDADYYALRPTISIAPPGGSAGPLPLPIPIIGSSGQVAIDLDGFFGLHPSLAPLEAMYAAGELAAVQATGLPQPDRSHFSAQLRMEVAGGARRAAGGWLGRYLAVSAQASQQSLRGISIGVALDQALAGSDSAAAIANSANYALQTTTPEAWRTALPNLHRDVGFEFRGVQQRVFAALDLLAQARPADIATDPAAVYPNDALGERMRQAAQYIKAGMGIEAITLNSEGWDHHVNENTVLPPLLTSLGQALSALRVDLGAHWQRTAVVVMSEFGRTVNENASGGTDHGRANMMLALGGRIAGGRVYGEWPGLAAANLDPTGDLAVRTDYRAVLADLLSGHMGLAGADIRHVFADLPGGDRPGLVL